MTDKSSLLIAAYVSEDERAAVEMAAGYLGRALSQATEVPWTCTCTFSPDLEALRHRHEVEMMVTSFLPELERIDEPWAQTEQRLRTTYTLLRERGAMVFICTVLRHVGGDKEPEAIDALRIRIRRLNFLAAEISHETGAYVIDLDRFLADIGARRLQTDYRLKGAAAHQLAGHFMAVTLVNNALDAVVPFEVQEAAEAILTTFRPAVAAFDGSRPGVTLKKRVVPIGQGRRKQLVLPIKAPDAFVGWYIQQVLRGAIGPAEAYHRLMQNVRDRGIYECFLMLSSGLLRQILPKK